MSYISILVPAFYLKEQNEAEIRKICCTQFEKTNDEFDLQLINDGQGKLEFALKFRQSFLSLAKIEELIYQRDCIKSLVEKTFESLHSMGDKLINLEKEMKLGITNSKPREGTEDDLSQNNLLMENQKLKDLLNMQLNTSENFRLNTEQTLNSIKEEFQQMVLELDGLRKQGSRHKAVRSMDFNKERKDRLLSSNVNKKIAGPESAGSKTNQGRGTQKNVPKLKLNVK